MQKINVYGLVVNYRDLREWKEKLDVVDDDADDTLEYTPKDTFIFNQEKSGKLTGDEIITIPHPIIVVSYPTILTNVHRTKLPIITQKIDDNITIF